MTVHTLLSPFCLCFQTHALLSLRFFLEWLVTLLPGEILGPEPATLPCLVPFLSCLSVWLVLTGRKGSCSC